MSWSLGNIYKDGEEHVLILEGGSDAVKINVLMGDKHCAFYANAEHLRSLVEDFSNAYTYYTGKRIRLHE